MSMSPLSHAHRIPIPRAINPGIPVDACHHVCPALAGVSADGGHGNRRIADRRHAEAVYFPLPGWLAVKLLTPRAET